MVGVRQLGVALPASANAVALPASCPPALVFSFAVCGQLAFLSLQRRFQVDVLGGVARTAQEPATASEVIANIDVGVAHVGVGAPVQGDEPRFWVLLDAELQQLLLGQRLQLPVHLGHGAVVEEHGDGHGPPGGVGRPARLFGFVAVGTALLLLLQALLLQVVVRVLRASSHLGPVFILVLLVHAVFAGKLGGQAHVVGRDDQGGHHAPVHVVLHLVQRAAEDDLTRLRVERSGPGEAFRRRCRVFRRFVRLTRHVALEARRRWRIGGVPAIVVGAVVSVVLGLLGLHGAVAPVVVFVQQRFIQVVGLGGARDLHGETFAPLGNAGVFSLCVSQHVSRNVLGQVLAGTLIVARWRHLRLVVGGSRFSMASTDEV